jgi:hypothetical protein
LLLAFLFSITQHQEFYFFIPVRALVFRVLVKELSVCLFAQVMSRHSWKDQAAQPKIKYFTQVKARPPTFVAFTSGKTQLSETDLRFLTKSLKEDFDLGGIPIRIMQRSVPRKGGGNRSKSTPSAGRMAERFLSDKRTADV